jgi:hypothetical protein
MVTLAGLERPVVARKRLRTAELLTGFRD